MNVNDQWMLERMQQMAASMAASLPRTSQNTETPKAEKGESFQDMMDKAKDQKVDTISKKDTTTSNTAKKDAVQQKEAVQKTDSAPQQTEKTSGAYNFDNTIAALVAAGFAQVDQVYPDGTVDITMDTTAVEGIFASTGSLLQQDDALTQVTLTTGDGQQITVSPKEIQEVFEAYGLEGPQKSDSAATLVGQIDPSKFQNATVITTDGAVTTLREAMAKASGEGEDDTDEQPDVSVMVSSQPLFKDVKAAPVKVGENFELDTQQPEMDGKLADAIRYAAQQGLKQVEIKLSPESLGELTVKLTQSADGALQVVLHTTNAKAANLLTQHMDGLHAALQGYSQEVRVEVQRGEDSQQTQQQNQQTDPDGHNRQQQQQQRREERHSGSQDFVQRLRLGLFGTEE